MTQQKNTWFLPAVRRLAFAGAALGVAQWQFFFALGASRSAVAWTHSWLLVLAGIVVAFGSLGAAFAHSAKASLALPTVRILPRGTSWRRGLEELASALLIASVAFCLVALARPYDPVSESRSEDSGIDIMVALDMSFSMNAVLDDARGRRITKADGLEHKPTRLDVAKEVIVDFAKKRPHDRIGGVVFGPEAYLLCPPTLDKHLFADLVSKLELGMVSGAGTSIGDGVGTAVARLRHATAPSKVLILITDGDNTSGQYAPEYAARLAQGAGVQLYTVQIGDGDWAEVEQGNDLAGRLLYGKVKYPVNPVLLQKMSSIAGGKSFVASKREELEESMHAILNQLATTKFVTEDIKVVELFPHALWCAAWLFALSVLCRLFVRRLL